MGEATGISWTDSTFNAWIGCAKVRRGCNACYAEADMADRRRRVVWGVNGTRSATSYNYWREPYKWNREAEAAGVRRRVFCSSLADVFEDWPGQLIDSNQRPLWFDPLRDRDCDCRPVWLVEKGDNEERLPLTLDLVRVELFRVIDATPWLDWQLVTKRPENISWMIPENSFHACVTGDCPHGSQEECVSETERRYRDNVWLLTSVSDQPTADKMIPELLKCRELSPVLGLSCEPLLGAIDLETIRDPKRFPGCAYFDVLRGRMIHEDDRNQWTEEPSHLDWVIIGGESGPNARPCRQTWIRDVVRQCSDVGVACFVKQFGSNAEEGFGAHRKLLLSDPKGGNPDEWPDDLRVRQFPKDAVPA